MSLGMQYANHQHLTPLTPFERNFLAKKTVPSYGMTVFSTFPMTCVLNSNYFNKFVVFIAN